MKKVSIILGIIGGLILLAALVFFVIGLTKPKDGGIFVDSVPASTVQINGITVGKTPYEATHKPGEIVVKIVPDDINLEPFETKVNINSNIRTIVKRKIGSSSEFSSGQIISFEKIGGKETSLSVVTVPDSAQINLDGSIWGFAPHKTSLIVPGEHELLITSPGFTDESFMIRTIQGYKLTAVVQLSAKIGENNVLQESTQAQEATVLVEILDTPTGYLRIRETPSTVGKEIGQVKPGEKYKFIESDPATGWLKIEYKASTSSTPAILGWVTNQYAKQTEGILPTPTSTLSPTP